MVDSHELAICAVMACEAGQGCRSGEGCGTNSCSSANSCSRDDESVHLSYVAKPGVCMKCKEEPTSDGFELCCTCLHTSLISKFKTAVNKNSLVTPADHILLALSGGPASRFDFTPRGSWSLEFLCLCVDFRLSGQVLLPYGICLK